jgi:predicted amidophosphoribosyltransferase
LDAARKEDIRGLWPWDDPDTRTLVKTRSTTKSATGTLEEKRRAAQEHAGALAITDGHAVTNRRVLLYDDVCTTGLQLDAVARYLIRAGAHRVEALVLARTPWGGE